MVITKDSESFDPGSSPGRTCILFSPFFHFSLVGVAAGLVTRVSSFGWMAEWSKALVSGTSLFGGESSNLSPITFTFKR